MIKNVNIHYSVELNEEDIKHYEELDMACDPEVIAFWNNLCKEKGEAFGCGNWWIDKTNGDKIRGMSDYELADFFERLVDCVRCDMRGLYCNGGSNATHEKCKENWFKWLKRKAATNERQST